MTWNEVKDGEPPPDGVTVSLRFHIDLVKLVVAEIDEKAFPITDGESAALGELGSRLLELARQEAAVPPKADAVEVGLRRRSSKGVMLHETNDFVDVPSTLRRASKPATILVGGKEVDRLGTALPASGGHTPRQTALARFNRCTLAAEGDSRPDSQDGAARTSRPRCMLRQSSPLRVGWDIVMASCLLYVAVIVPYLFAFEESGPPQTLEYLDLIVDSLFCLDVLLNFRTGYTDSTGAEVLDWRRVGWRYATTWLLVDLVSSVPFGKITDGYVDGGSSVSKDMQPATKLLKTGKILRALKIFKVGKLMNLFDQMEVIESLDEALTSSRFQARARLTSVLLSTVVLCHWMACFMAASGSGYLDDYQDVENAVWKQYLAALYWSMTTMTTTGYGDIIPGSDWERAYAMIAMVIGGSFYGYVIGSIASAISKEDLNKRAYQEGMDLILAWLDHHQFPSHLRRRVRRYFKAYLNEKSAIDETAILNDMSPELREDVGKFLIHDFVRFNPLFKDLPKGVLAHLVQIQQKATAEQDDCIIEQGEEGSAMFIIIQGTARMAVATSPSGASSPSGDPEEKPLGSGGSFGEEVVLGLEEQYRYSVTATSDVVLLMLPKVNFLAIFLEMPKVFCQMRANCTGEVCAGVDSKTGRSVTVRLPHNASSNASSEQHTPTSELARDFCRDRAKPAHQAHATSSCTAYRSGSEWHPYHRTLVPSHMNL